MKKTLFALILAFSGSAYAVECLNYPMGPSIGMSIEEKQSSARKIAKDNEDDAKTLLMCFMSTASLSPEKVLKAVCGCKESIEKACGVKKKNGVITINPIPGAQKPWCAPFAPLLV